MNARIEELDWCDSPIGVISLRRRHDTVLDLDVYEVKIDDEFLMSSYFTASEIALATLGLAAVTADPATVLVGGLGLGYTARAVLQDPRVSNLTVVEAIAPVIDWHRRDLLPDTVGLAADPRCSLVHEDFFAMVAGGSGTRRYDAVLVDIDHSPVNTLHSTHGAFYTPDGLRRLEHLLVDDGVFGLWSDDPPAAEFEAVLGEVFVEAESHVVTFPNPLTRGESSCTVYVGRGFRARG